MIREAIKQQMKLQGLRAAQLARTTNIPRSVISEFLNGRHDTSVERIEAMCEVLNIKLCVVKHTD